MKKICLNCNYAKVQFLNLVKNVDGSHKYPFDKAWDLAMDDLLICTNLKSDFRSIEVNDNHSCNCFKLSKGREDDLKNGC